MKEGFALTKNLERLLDYVIAIIFFIMLIVVFAQVVCRYGLNFSIPWAEELARFSMVWLVFLGTALMIKERGHTKVDYFIKLLPVKFYKLANILINLILIIFVASLIYYSIPFVKSYMTDITPALGIPYGLVAIAFPISGILMILYLIKDAIRWQREEGKAE